MQASTIAKISEMINQGTVVVIEPSPNYRKTLKRYLSNLKAKSVKVYDKVAEAKVDMAVSRTSLMIVEWHQPGQNGLQFCREIRQSERFKEIPFLLLSTEGLRSDVVLASEVGIDGYMLKPFSYEDFAEQLFALIKTSQERIKYMHLMEQAESLLENAEFEKAEQLFDQGKDYHGTTARALVGIGRIRISQGYEEDAIAIFKQAIEKNEAYLEAYRWVIDLFQSREQSHHVLHYALKAHELSPENPRYMLNIARAFLSIGDLEQSEDYFRRVIRISPALAEAHKGLGDVQMLREDYDQAMQNYQKALDLDGDDVSILNSMGLVFVKQGAYEKGIQKYKLALGVDAKNSKVLFNIGYAHEKIGELDKARGYYNLALINEPDYDKPHRGLARVQKLLRASA